MTSRVFLSGTLAHLDHLHEIKRLTAYMREPYPMRGIPVPCLVVEID